MARPDVRQMLAERFLQPLEDYASRRIVIWHDAEGSFSDLFDELQSVSAGGFDEKAPRRLVFARAEEGGLFALKRRIYRQEPDADFLIYTRTEKDFSARALQGNWLADVELIAEHFQADLPSMRAEELGATDGAVAGIRRFQAFFNAADRRERFRALMPHARSEGDVALGVIGSVLGARDLATESIVRAWLCDLEKGGDPVGDLRHQSAEDAFASFISQRTGYTGDLAATDDAAAHLLITALSAQMPAGALSGLEGRISRPHAQFCLNIVHAWMADERDAATLYSLARRVEDACGLPGRFRSMELRDLADADVLPCINEVLLTTLLASLADGADRADEALEVIRRRRSMRWFGRLQGYFDALGRAADMQRFFREHAEDGFHQTKAADTWKAYVSDWYRMDSAYRGFCQALHECQISSADVPEELEDALECCASWAEHLYANWYLNESNACWAQCAQDGWRGLGHVDGIAQEERFFDDRVRSGQAQVKKTLVIISDALRYEVAEELARRLEGDTRGTTQLGSMQASFPSITEFGMAALLPHASMTLQEGRVLLDGLSTATTAQRQEVLRRAEPAGVCVQAKDLMGARRAERRQMVGEAPVVYVYHNQIDATGEGYQTEDKVFAACDDAIDELVALVKIAINDLQFTRVLITADHGFIYTRMPLEERDKASGSDAGVDTGIVLQGRRYLVCEGEVADAGPFLRINLGQLGGGSYLGLAPRECVRIKKAGPGEKYVHGGVSLQEACIPVIEFRNRRSGQKGYEERESADFVLMSTSRLVSSMLFSIDLLQDKPVGGKVLPAEYALVMCDASGNEVSETRRAVADMVATDATGRVLHVSFALKAGTSYDSHVPYYLVCRDAASGSIAWKEEFHIDIPFAPLDDFGF